MKTVRILALDGGGIRGIFSAQFMKTFCSQAGITNIWQEFDIITGTSIGGVLALAYANGLSPSDILNLLIDNGPMIFNGYFGLGPAGTASLGTILSLPGYNPVLYPNDSLKAALTSALGTTKMFQMKTNVLITSFGYLGGTVGSDDSSPIIPPATGDYSNTYFPYSSSDYPVTAASPVNFSNVILPFTSGANNFAVDVALTTSAAPIYFPPVQLSTANNPTKDTWYIDGGLYQNNPAALGYTLANILYPNYRKLCTLSVGTGLTKVGFDIPINQNNNFKIAPTNSLPMFADLLSMTIAGAQDAVDEQFRYVSLYNGARDNLYYYRFQTKYPDDFPAELDYVQPGFDTNLINAANVQYGLDQDRISAFIENCNF